MNVPEKFTKENLSDFPSSFIFATIFRQHTIFLKHKLEPYNITAGEYPIIMMLYKEDKKTQQEIAKSFYMTEGTIARTVRNLEDKKIIQRQTDENNRRRNFVYLTTEGKEIASLIADLEKQWEEEVCKFQNTKEMDEFKEILYEITMNSFKINKQNNN